MPESLPRRAAIAKILNIPLLLLGVSPLVGQNTSAGTLELLESLAHTTSNAMIIYERMLALCWETCYTSSFQRAAADVAFCVEELEQAADNVQSLQRQQINYMLCRFYQLAGIIARDRMDFTQALYNGTKAVDLALELDNAELIAAALEHRSGTYARRRRYDLALTDIQRALPYADRSRDILRGNVYLVAAEKYTRTGLHDSQTEKTVMAFLDTAGRIVRKGKLENDGSFLKLNVASLHIEQAKLLACFQHFDAAHNSFAIAHKHLGPDLLSWKANIYLEEAEAFLQEGELDGSCERALKALRIVRTLQSRSREERIQQLHHQYKSKDPNNALVCALGQRLGPCRVKPLI
ncbi:hypothetical protein EPA93_07180 [Ktedonosporobacter rubrisoli]|uniref:Tetratricopeptide repeat protein n=1 Tax=Ktedonosporobacter rubrisoli TaxID=2509675 RepID=A0A4P6JLA4_KTERU|nr:hypothetical protein [Ktedonosporobacter rubrisoli]QBD75800.1 hypothetical protein EPA93_07180 [Ktedonosporobacter rubrisoli]